MFIWWRPALVVGLRTGNTWRKKKRYRYLTLTWHSKLLAFSFNYFSSKLFRGISSDETLPLAVLINRFTTFENTWEYMYFSPLLSPVIYLATIFTQQILHYTLITLTTMATTVTLFIIVTSLFFFTLYSSMYLLSMILTYTFLTNWSVEIWLLDFTTIIFGKTISLLFFLLLRLLFYTSTDVFSKVRWS